MADNEMEIRGISIKNQIKYALGHVLNDIFASMWFTYLLVYFHLVLKFSFTESGFILFVGQVADAISTPFIGYQSDKIDNYWMCRYGRRKSWHLIGTICTLTSFPFIFNSCVECENSDKWAQLFYYSAFVVIFQFGWAAVQISHLSLIPELTQNEHQRTQLTAIRYTFTVFSNVLVYCVTWWALGNITDAQINPSNKIQFQQIVAIVLCLGTVASIIFHLTVQEPIHYNFDTDSTGSPVYSDRSLNTNELRQRSIYFVLIDPLLYAIGIIYMTSRLFINVSQVLLPLYLHETLKLNAQSLAILPLCVHLSSFFTSLLVNRLNVNGGRKISYSVGAIFALIVCIWIKIHDTEYFIKYEIYGVAIFLGISISILLIISLSLTADYIGSDTNRNALIYGIMSFTDKLSNGIAIFIIQHLHSTEFCEHTYYRDALAYVCGGAVLLGSIVVLVGIKVTVTYGEDQFIVVRHAEGSQMTLSDEYEPIDVYAS